MKAVDAQTAQASQLPLSRRQFSRFLLVFHAVFLAGLVLILVNRWNHAGFAWIGREVFLLAVVSLQVVLYWRFFVSPREPAESQLRWGLYFTCSYVLWLVEWQIEPLFEWVVLAYLGQMFGVLRPRYSIPASGVVFLVYLSLRIGWARMTHLTLQEAVSYSLLVVGWTALGLFIHKLVTTSSERARLIRELEQAQRELEASRDKDRELAVLRERERLARDLHDGLGHSLVTLTVQMEAAKRLISTDPARAAGLVDSMMNLTRGCTGSLRRSLAGLRSPTLGDRPVLPALREVAEAMARRSGIEVEWKAPDQIADLSPSCAEAIWGVVQEALANVERHSGAQRVTVELEQTSLGGHGRELLLRVVDNGKGLEAGAESRPGHFGLRGARERVEGLGGSFCVSSEPGRSTLLEARIPLLG